MFLDRSVMVMKRLGMKELEQAGKLAAEEARKEAFSAGTFISFGRNGRVLRQYPDGRITEVIYDGAGNRKEVDYAGG
jgi:YD repeat-containing protein